MPVPTHPLTSVLASAAMKSPIVSCRPGDTVAQLAASMASHRVHALLLEGVFTRDGVERLAWGVVSDADLLRAAVRTGPAAVAAEIASTEPLTVEATDDLAAVADRLVAHRATHVIVVDDERPVGVISTLDLAAALAAQVER